MGRGGRSQKFLDHWHQRELELAGDGVLRWVLIDDPRHVAPHAECFRLTLVDGATRSLHTTEAFELLVEHNHADVEYVRVETSVGKTFTH